MIDDFLTTYIINFNGVITARAHTQGEANSRDRRRPGGVTQCIHLGERSCH